MPNENFSFNDTHSRLRYIPEEETDFGLVYCWARNSMGVMRTPCVFQLIPAGKKSHLCYTYNKLQYHIDGVVILVFVAL